MNQGNAALFSIQDVPMMYKNLFEKELDFFKMLEVCRFVLRQTGGIASKTYLFKGTIENFKLHLPCNVFGIKHVSDSRPVSWYSGCLLNEQQNLLLNYRVDQSGNLGVYNPNATNVNNLDSETPIVYEVNKNVFSRPLGLMIDFENDDNKCLHFNHKWLPVDVLYVGTPTDSDGYPKVPEKVIWALAYFMHFLDVSVKYNMKQVDLNAKKEAEREKDIAIAQARVPDWVSTNETDDILNALTSFNRKQHNRQRRE